MVNFWPLTPSDYWLRDYVKLRVYQEPLPTSQDNIDPSEKQLSKERQITGSHRYTKTMPERYAPLYKINTRFSLIIEHKYCALLVSRENYSPQNIQERALNSPFLFTTRVIAEVQLYLVEDQYALRRTTSVPLYVGRTERYRILNILVSLKYVPLSFEITFY